MWLSLNRSPAAPSPLPELALFSFPIMECQFCGQLRYRRSWSAMQWNAWSPTVRGPCGGERNCCRECNPNYCHAGPTAPPHQIPAPMVPSHERARMGPLFVSQAHGSTGIQCGRPDICFLDSHMWPSIVHGKGGRTLTGSTIHMAQSHVYILCRL